MSHDFAKGKTSKRSSSNSGKRSSGSKANARRPAPTEKPRLPGWAWFICGIVFTLFGQLLFQLAQVDTSELEEVAAEQSQPSEKPKKKPAKKPRIEFYDTLKHREVKVSGDVVEAREQEDYNYALQAGAFKNHNDAEQARAEIILMGLDASIESRKNKSGTMYHRIIVGPFTSRSALASARNKLINNNMPSMKIKR